jgi:Ca2+-binding RTX toxin-like protein
VNDAPTAVNFSNVRGSLAENTSTAAAIKVADIAVTDVDGGSNGLSLAGADAALFQIIGGDLWLRAGARLDFETNPVLDVTVRVNDAAVGGPVDAFKSLAIAIGNVAERINGTGGADRLSGTGAGETLSGLGGNDRLAGNGGDDRLDGGLGADVLSGGQGRDVFVFLSVSHSAPGQSGYVNNGAYSAIAGQGQRDIITDFTHGQDRIDLSAIDANMAIAGNQAFSWRGFGNFSSAPGQLIEKMFDQAGTANDKTVIYGDVNGDARADFQIELTGLKALVAGDFVL